MTSKVALGWEVSLAVNDFSGYTVPGRLCVVGSEYWARDWQSGYMSYDGPSVGSTMFRADSDRTLGAMIAWLTGKTSGANILIVQAATTEAGMTHGDAVRDALTRLGHTYTLTGSAVLFNGYEPLDFDLTMPADHSSLSTGESYHGINTPASAKWDYILSHDGHVLASYSGWDRYGFTSNVAHQADLYWHHAPIFQYGGFGPPYWGNQVPFACAPFGDPGIGGGWDTNFYAFSVYPNFCLQTTTNTKGGSSTVYNCALDEEPTSNHTRQNGAIGLWSAS